MLVIVLILVTSVTVKFYAKMCAKAITFIIIIWLAARAGFFGFYNRLGVKNAARDCSKTISEIKATKCEQQRTQQEDRST